MASQASAQWAQQQVLTNSLVGAFESKPFDYEGDGDIDFLTANINSGNLFVHRNNGNGTYTQITLPGVSGLTTCGNIHLVDPDGDGDLDILVGASGQPTFFPPSVVNSELFLLRNNGGGSWQKTWSNTNPGFPGGWDLDTADMNGDGNLDIVFSLGLIYDQIGWRAGTGFAGGGAFGSGSGGVNTVVNGQGNPNGQNNEPRDIELADVDGDGDTDVLVCFYISNELAWFRNNGNGASFTRFLIEGSAMGARQVRAGDLNGDGIVDVVRTTVLNGQIAYFLGQGNGSFGSKVIVSTVPTSASGGGTSGNDPRGPRGMSLADFDDDGDLDIVVASETNGEVIVHYNNGAASFTNPATVVSTTAGSVVHVFPVDADGDGDTDIVSTATATGRVRLHPNDCNGNCGTVTTFGSSCDAAPGVAPNLSSNAPKLGQSWNLAVGNVGSAPAAFVLFGSQPVNPGFPLFVLGAPGCSAYTNADLGAFVAPNLGGAASYLLAVPNSSSVIGAELTCQGTVASTLNTFGIATTNALSVRVGN